MKKPGLTTLFFHRIFTRHRDFIYAESRSMRDFLCLLTKQRNTGIKWTNEEISQIKVHLKHLSLYVPSLIIFLLPFGSLLLPVLAEILERRKQVRKN